VSISAALPLEAIISYNHEAHKAQAYQNFSKIRQCIAELLMIKQFFLARFSRVPMSS